MVEVAVGTRMLPCENLGLRSSGWDFSDTVPLQLVCTLAPSIRLLGFWTVIALAAHLNCKLSVHHHMHGKIANKMNHKQRYELACPLLP